MIIFPTSGNRYRYIVGIDPGTHTGFAVYDIEKSSLVEVETLSIDEAIEKVCAYRCYGTLLLRVENPNTWKPFGRQNHNAKIQGAGSVKRDFAIWKDFANRKGIDFEAVSLHAAVKKPTAEYFKQLTKWTARTSSHSRDAAMLCFRFEPRKILKNICEK